MKSITIKRTVNAPLEAVWTVVSDLAGYARYAPNLNTSKVVSGDGVGMVRECSSKEGRWQEHCTHWQEQSSYQFQVQTQAKDYPFPFKLLHGKWIVESHTANQTVICMVFHVEFKNQIVGWLLFPIMRVKFMQVCKKLLDNWQQAIQLK